MNGSRLFVCFSALMLHHWALTCFSGLEVVQISNFFLLRYRLTHTFIFVPYLKRSSEWDQWLHLQLSLEYSEFANVGWVFCFLFCAFLVALRMSGLTTESLALSFCSTWIEGASRQPLAWPWYLLVKRQIVGFTHSLVPMSSSDSDFEDLTDGVPKRVRSQKGCVSSIPTLSLCVIVSSWIWYSLSLSSSFPCLHNFLPWISFEYFMF